MPERMESNDGAALEFGDDQFNEVSSVFRSCFDPRRKPQYEREHPQSIAGDDQEHRLR